MEIVRLFLAFLQVGALSFGGGYAAIPLISRQAIDHYGWLTVSDFSDLVTIAETTPGPIAVNAATFVGMRVAGLPGALAATFGVILPSCLFVTLFTYIYYHFRKLAMVKSVLASLRPAVVSMIFTAGLTILIPTFFGNVTGLSDILINTNYRAVVLFLAALVLLRRFKVNPVIVMLITGGAELISHWLLKLL
ncbi:MAG: chromate transporter [Lachnospiraceae bacterium]|nr:chromate transporter [Lachnospiraceae bacterium]